MVDKIGDGLPLVVRIVLTKKMTKLKKFKGNREAPESGIHSFMFI